MALDAVHSRRFDYGAKADIVPEYLCKGSSAKGLITVP